MTKRRYVINESNRKSLAGTRVDNVKPNLMQHRVPTTGQSLDRPGQSVGKKPIQGGSPIDG